MAPDEQVPTVRLRRNRGRASCCLLQRSYFCVFQEHYRNKTKQDRSICLTTFPLDLTKTRLQMQGEAALARLGDGAVDSAPYRGMVRTALGIVQEEGFLKLWQGVTPAIYRHCTLEVGWSPMNIYGKSCLAKVKISIIPSGSGFYLIRNFCVVQFLKPVSRK
eukprot:XP_017173174.1 PREDICTED: mitochondrial uncoupling protein 4 isoform X10 [Mus musculus]